MVEKFLLLEMILGESSVQALNLQLPTLPLFLDPSQNQGDPSLGKTWAAPILCLFLEHWNSWAKPLAHFLHLGLKWEKQAGVLHCFSHCSGAEWAEQWDKTYFSLQGSQCLRSWQWGDGSCPFPPLPLWEGQEELLPSPSLDQGDSNL